MISHTFWRFCIVGSINTLIDVGLFVPLHMAGMSMLVANICSTTAALLASFALNRAYTFRSSATISTRQIVLYGAGTLFGLWILQPLIMQAVIFLDTYVHYVSSLQTLFGHSSVLASLVPKLVSIALLMLWNYCWYRNVVFTAQRLRRSSDRNYMYYLKTDRTPGI